MLSAGLMHLGFLPIRDFIVVNDGENERILSWRSLRPQPTTETIAAAAALVDPLAPSRESEKRAVDDDAGTQRLKYISGGDGQELVYQRKAEEARKLTSAIAADPQFEPEPSDYPMLTAGIGLDGATLSDCAALVLAKDAAWTAIAASIDIIRRTARADIDMAADEAAIRAVRPAIQWP